MNLLDMDSEQFEFEPDLDLFTDENAGICSECGSVLELDEHTGRCLKCGSELELDEFETDLDDLEWKEEIKRGGRRFSRPTSLRARPTRAFRRRIKGGPKRRPRPLQPSGALRPKPKPWPPKPWPPKRPTRPIIIRPRRRRPVVIREPTAPCVCPAHGTEFVRWVQSSLNQILGLRLRVNGVMNRATRDALRDFQKREGLPVDGIAGLETKKALVDAKAGQSGGTERVYSELEDLEFDLADLELEGEVNRKSREYVRWIQRSLNKILGLRLAVDGIVGPKTRSAVRGFQRRQGLVIDGIVGPRTENALVVAGADSPPTTGAIGTIIMPDGPFGKLTISSPEKYHFSYKFSPEDVLWTARFIIGESGGDNDLDNQAVIWAMFNRYAFFTHKYYPSFHQFIRAYSTPLQPTLKSWAAAKRHMHNADFVRTGGFYKAPHDYIPRGQLRRFLNLQKTPWRKLKPSARQLAEQALRGLVPNPIGNASEFDNTRVYFRSRYKRNPSHQEWIRYTTAFAKPKKWEWIGPVPGLNQMNENTFFVQKRVKKLAKNIVRVIPYKNIPSTVIDERPDIVSVRGIKIARQIAPQIDDLLASSRADGINLSGWGYRSHAKQIELRKKHCGPSQDDIYNKPSSSCTPPTARPGKSMHEKGLAIDFTYNGNTIESQNNPGFQWLAKNAAGFGLRNLPSEPWHWSTNGR